MNLARAYTIFAASVVLAFGYAAYTGYSILDALFEDSVQHSPGGSGSTQFYHK